MVKLANVAVVTFTACLTACVTSCASFSPQKQRWIGATSGVAVGSAVGASVTPSGERRELHASYWAAVIGLAAYFTTDLLVSDDAKYDALKSENEKLQLQLQVIQGANTILLKEGKGFFKSSSGEDLFRGQKAKWKLFQIDKWSKDGPNRLFHQDRVIELTPLSDSGGDN